jgi:NAD(P)-dependent dehydrogenase (short-subunit alcohol dehydrogenase family)
LTGVTPEDVFDLEGRVAVVTGASGAIGSSLARGFAGAGARVALLARRTEPLEALARELAEAGSEALACPVDVLDPAQLAAARDTIVQRLGAVDVLVNAAGGNISRATLDGTASPFDLDLDATREVVELNLMGALTTIVAFGPALEAPTSGDRSILTVSSMAAARALTRVGGYGAAKAGLESLTRWLAVELGRRGTGIRVNAIAPGFFVGEQNRSLLLAADGEPTERGRTILEQTPLGRFGEPDDLVATALWLSSGGARFVTGAVVPVDGGFSAFGGV